MSSWQLVVRPGALSCGQIFPIPHAFNAFIRFLSCVSVFHQQSWICILLTFRENNWKKVYWPNEFWYGKYWSNVTQTGDLDFCFVNNRNLRPGYISGREGNCSKEALKILRPRATRVQEWSYFNRQITTQKSCETIGMLFRWKWTAAHLWIYAQQKPWCLPFRLAS